MTIALQPVLFWPRTVFDAPGATIRQQIMTAVANRLLSITTTNGYNTDLGNNMEAWRVEAIESGDIPAGDVRDQQHTTAIAIGTDEHTLSVEISVTAKGETSAADIRKAIADVITCIGLDNTWGGLAEGTTIKSDSMDMQPSEEIKAAARIRCEIEYTTDPMSPYL